MADSLYSIAVLIDELKNDDPQVRLNSVRKLQDISRALGPDRTRNELIPYLNDSVDDEEIALALAEELGNMIDLVGGPGHSGVLVTPLEALGGVEENAVREKAAESFSKIINRASADIISDHIIPAMHRMCASDWFSSRATACHLFAAAYPKAGALKGDLRNMFSELCRDDTPMVRRAAASQLGKLAKEVEKELAKSELIHLLGKLAQDDQDSVRLLCIEGCISIGQLLSPEENASYILPTIRSCGTDKSWRVRYMVAENYGELAKTMGVEITKAELVPAYVKLLKDAEPEVKTAAASKVSSFCTSLPPEIIMKQIMPCVRELAGDPSQHVRAALASVIVGIGALLSRNSVIDSLLPIILQLLKDESSEVRLNVISKLDAMNQSVGLDLLYQSLLPAIVELAEDKSWRVRMAIIEQMPVLATLLGVRFFDDKFNNLCTAWLGDPVFSVREAATTNLKKLAEAFGQEWAKANVVPKILLVAQHPNYLYRMATLHSIQVLYPIVTPDIISSVFIPLLTRLGSDPVPNIRFNVAKTIQSLISSMEPSVLGQAKSILARMVEDHDRDVKYYANQAFQKC
eukprot:TRINITY_DN8918_c0_g2_i1.p1 TRINITY_DN8918_c0_g2~~TRINITY_DN8918_c0_g2_i1.p1  ORF type:complete len:575 (-),score=137.22 TRINITY_DN8918_c0_g2_i1:475-2199(-)